MSVRISLLPVLSLFLLPKNDDTISCALFYRRTYAEAAVRPSPREPPVTTATLPFTLKSEEKSWILMSSMMQEMRFVRYKLELLADSCTFKSVKTL